MKMERVTLKKKKWLDIAEALSLLTQLGLMVVVCVFGCVFVGIYLDKRLNTSPVLALVFLAIGIGSAFASVYRTLGSYYKKGK